MSVVRFDAETLRPDVSPSELRVESCQANVDMSAVECGELSQQVQVSHDERIFCDDRDGLAAGEANLKTLPRQLELAFAGLIAVSHSGERD